jgi:hypothetical protein
MEFKGGSAKGFAYGQLSPLDYTGLKLWLRATDGLTFARGNSVKQWNDLSGNGNHFTASSFPLVDNTVYGPVVKAGNSGTSGMGCISPVGTWNFLGNGSPFSFLLITGQITSTASSAQQVATRGLASAGFNNTSATAEITKNSAPSVAADYVLRNAGSGGNTGAAPTVTTPARPANFGEFTHYGSAGTPYKYIAKSNGVLIRRWTAYTSVPDPAQQMGQLTLFLPNGNPNSFFEWIVYDQTGKTQAQIDAEILNLSERYIKKRYPNIY